ncbi:MAG: hypothetical protein R3B13_35975 [Polyangiaceae bacterium]
MNHFFADGGCPARCLGDTSFADGGCPARCLGDTSFADGGCPAHCLGNASFTGECGIRALSATLPSLANAASAHRLGDTSFAGALPSAGPTR